MNFIKPPMPERDLRTRTEQLFRYLNDLVDSLNRENTALRKEIDALKKGE